MNKKPDVPEVDGIDLDYTPAAYFAARHLHLPLPSDIQGQAATLPYASASDRAASCSGDYRSSAAQTAPDSARRTTEAYGLTPVRSGAPSASAAVWPRSSGANLRTGVLCKEVGAQGKARSGLTVETRFIRKQGRIMVRTNLRHLILLACLLASLDSAAQNSQTNRMADCNAAAGERTGDERKRFMGSCLSARVAPLAASPLSPPSEAQTRQRPFLDRTNDISVGMTKSQIIATLGRPDMASARGGVEVLSYKYPNPLSVWVDSTYVVRLEAGRVDAYGDLQEFAEPVPETKSTIDLNIQRRR